MKRSDLFFTIFIIVVFAPFFIYDDLYNGYIKFNSEHSYIMSYIKFAFLATLGEVITLRMTQKVYNKKGFGILPRAIVWGFLGILIKVAFVIFATGTPNLISSLGFNQYPDIVKAFTISVTMNIFFAPVMMTLHKITDIHIINNGGTIKGLFRPIEFAKIFPTINWEIMWGFVFKKTIPLFWIPAHTITFMLPKDFQILFAALLGIALGVILAFASKKSEKK
ncbi:MAG: hypothetical protein CR982_05970 [Candidatus Cloacimonadota bacterium]|nr:MAG: hypothetical protein CR982_05970 [Candidatus Cloacimonadota bacterium]PIE78067.1 MAG: hypothetical protein CSA15_09530 [Candidatus Delongbacteria bacterium]